MALKCGAHGCTLRCAIFVVGKKLGNHNNMLVSLLIFIISVAFCLKPNQACILNRTRRLKRIPIIYASSLSHSKVEKLHERLPTVINSAFV
jgi:hypothetical protein